MTLVTMTGSAACEAVLSGALQLGEVLTGAPAPCCKTLLFPREVARWVFQLRAEEE